MAGVRAVLIAYGRRSLIQWISGRRTVNRAQQLRKLGNVDRDAPRLFCEVVVFRLDKDGLVGGWV